MKIDKVKRTIEVSVVTFEDGTKIDVSVVRTFFDEACEIIDTIGKDGNYTDEYVHFKTKAEKILEPILLKYDVIRKSPKHKGYNNSVTKETMAMGHRGYCYWLSDGYKKFYEDFWKAID